MSHHLDDRLYYRKMTRRDFLWLTSITTASMAMTGCAVNPVTGQSQFMLVSEASEIQLDRQNSPHQFSADYGAVQDRPLNHYITQIGQNLANHSHRPRMPYSFRCVNATYANAYAFPGGSIAATRGILITLNNEAELAALLGHEIGHVNARHTASQMSTNLLLGAALAIGTAYVEVKHKKYAPWVKLGGQIGAGMLLAHYSRDNERQADALGMEYMTRVGYNPTGMVGLMDELRKMSKHQPNLIETMFATHPMSEERYQTAKVSATTAYRAAKKFSLNQERYLDNIANLRAIKGAIEAMQQGDEAMKNEEFDQAEQYFRKALKRAPDDYVGLVMMAKCQIAQEEPEEAMEYAEHAKQVYPTEAQAYHLNGIAQMMNDDFETAYHEFKRYEKILPGNPNTFFLKGSALEGMQQKDEAASQYSRYLQLTNDGEQAQYARNKLIQWGYIKQK